MADTAALGSALNTVKDANNAVNAVTQGSTANAIDIVTDPQKSMSDINSKISVLTKQIEKIEDPSQLPQKLEELKALNKQKNALLKAKTQKIYEEFMKKQDENLAKINAALSLAKEQRKAKAPEAPVPPMAAAKEQGKTDDDPTLTDRVRDYLFSKVNEVVAPSAAIPGATSAIPQNRHPTYPANSASPTFFESAFPTKEKQQDFINRVIQNKIKRMRIAVEKDTNGIADNVKEMYGISKEKFNKLHEKNIKQIENEIQEGNTPEVSVNGQPQLFTKSMIYGVALERALKDIVRNPKDYPISQEWKDAIETEVKAGNNVAIFMKSLNEAQGDTHKVGGADCTPEDHAKAPCTPDSVKQTATNKISVKQ